MLRSTKHKMLTKWLATASIVIELKQLVNCFLKAHEGFSYFYFGKSISLVRINSEADNYNTRTENTFWGKSRHDEVARQLLPKGQ